MEASGGDFVAVGVTSNPLMRPHSVGLTNDDMEEGELPKPIRVRVDKIFNLNREQARKRFGQVNEDCLSRIVASVSEMLCR